MFIRASTAADANTGTQQKLVIDGLTYQPSTYYYLRLFNETTGDYYDVSSNGGGSSPNYYSVAYTFAVTPNTTNYYRAEAKWQSQASLTTVYNQLTSPGGTTPKPTALGWADKTSGAPFSLLASSWNNLTDKINEWRVYQGKSTLTFTTAVSNGSFTASMFNQVCNGIASLSPPLSQPATVSSGDAITAAKINRLSDSIDSLI